MNLAQLGGPGGVARGKVVSAAAAEAALRRLLPELPALRFQHLMRIVRNDFLRELEPSSADGSARPLPCLSRCAVTVPLERVSPCPCVCLRKTTVHITGFLWGSQRKLSLAGAEFPTGDASFLGYQQSAG